MYAGAVEPNVQGYLFEPQVKKTPVLHTHFLGLKIFKVILRTQFGIDSTTIKCTYTNSKYSACLEISL